MGDMSRLDAERLHQLIVNHARYTGSTRAREILENWESYLPKFRKVMPVEYRRALAELAGAERRRGVAGCGRVRSGVGASAMSVATPSMADRQVRWRDNCERDHDMRGRTQTLVGRCSRMGRRLRAVIDAR